MANQNQKYVDLLDEDTPIAGQKFGCISFVSPERIIKQREIFYFEEFVKQWSFIAAGRAFESYLHFLTIKYNIPFADLIDDYNQFVVDEESELRNALNVSDDYKTFVEKFDADLMDAFQKVS